MYVIPSLVKGTLNAGHYSVSWDRIFSFGVGVAVLGLIVLFVNRTRWGKQMQAITQNREAAALQGINIFNISAIVTVLGCAMAAIAGVLMGSMYTLDPFMGQNTLTKILILVILAGVGSVGGIFIIGLILGTLYGVLPILVQGSTSDALAYGIVCILLLIRPQGFFGHEA